MVISILAVNDYNPSIVFVILHLNILITYFFDYLHLKTLFFFFSSRRNPPIGTRDYIGWGIWTIGFIFEVVADAQKSIFRANPQNKVSSNLQFS